MSQMMHQYQQYSGKRAASGGMLNEKEARSYASSSKSSFIGGSTRHHLFKAVSSALARTVVFMLFVDLWLPCLGIALPLRSLPARSIQHYARATTSSLLEVFQIYPPVLTVSPAGVLEITDGSSNVTVDVVDSNSPTCQQTIAVHSFANSYGVPFVGSYVPPSCTFNRVTWNLTVTSAGRQFDRIGIIYLGDIEVFRTSTAEPTAAGIEWTYLKDMTSFVSLFKEEQKLIFDLGNLINDLYTAAFDVTLTAAFFNANHSIMPADLIVPISTRQSSQNAPSVFIVPDVVASNNLTLPQNIEKAVLTVAATGQMGEEFWWSNVLSSDVDTFPSYGELYGYSPFREVQVFIDGMLAGVAWPFPVIFTGGVVPRFWRPIVGIDAFDLREDEIDITPWLPLLCDGRAHNFTIRVAGLNDSGNGTATLAETVGSNWLVTGKVFVWLDEASHITTGQGPYSVTPSPRFEVSSSIGTTSNGTNETLIYQVDAQRSLSLRSTINTSRGLKQALWQQDLSYSNMGNYSDQGNVEINSQQTNGYDQSSSGYARNFSYPLYLYSAYATNADNYSIVANVNRGKDVQLAGQPVFPTALESFAVVREVDPQHPKFQGSWLSTTQHGSATVVANTTSNTSFSFGTTEQDMMFAGLYLGTGVTLNPFPPIDGMEELFHRHALAVNGTVIEDVETSVNRSIKHTHVSKPSDGRGFALLKVPGRGRRRPGLNRHE